MAEQSIWPRSQPTREYRNHHLDSTRWHGYRPRPTDIVVTTPLEGGGLIIHEAVALTPAEAAHYSDPVAIDTLNEALRQAKAGKTRNLTLRSQ